MTVSRVMGSAMGLLCEAYGGEDANRLGCCYARALRKKGLDVLEGFTHNSRLRLWAIWIGSTTLILLFVVLQINMEGVCWDKKIVEAAKINEAAGCLDFWLNRYQTLLTQGIADIAAIVAGVLLFRQIELTRDQARETAQQAKSAAGALAIDNIEFLIRCARANDEILKNCIRTRGDWRDFTDVAPIPGREFDADGFSRWIEAYLPRASAFCEQYEQFKFIFTDVDLGYEAALLRKRLEDLFILGIDLKESAIIGRDNLFQKVERVFDFTKTIHQDIFGAYNKILEHITLEVYLTNNAIKSTRKALAGQNFAE